MIAVDPQRKVDVLIINTLVFSERRTVIFDQVKLVVTYTVPSAPVIGWWSFDLGQTQDRSVELFGTFQIRHWEANVMNSIYLNEFTPLTR